MNYLLIMDLDNTLLNNNKEITNYTKRILDECKKENKIVISTSRSYKRTIKYSNEIKADYISCFDGNFVCDSNYKILYNHPFSKKESKQIIKILKENDYNIISENLYNEFCTDLSGGNCVEAIPSFFKAIESYDNYKFLINTDYKNFDSIKSLLNDYADISFDSYNSLVRVLPKNSNKWNGINLILTKQRKNYKTIVFGDDISDLQSLKKADIGIKMENSTKEIDKEIEFSTASNEEDGVAKFLCNYFNLIHSEVNFENIKLLDCSLRDGGHLNKSIFGQKIIDGFINKLIKSNIDIIEIGFLEDCDYDKDTAKYPNIDCAEKILDKYNPKNSIFSLLTQVDKFNISNLKKCTGKVKMIRVSFHDNLVSKGMEYCEKIKKLGYICSINPINFSNYNNSQVVELITKVNKVNPDIFTIVDTFGIFLNNDFKNKLSLLNHLLNKNIKIAIHLHDNLNQPFSSAQVLIENNTFKNDIIIDTSINGIGRSPGNLKTELMAYYINNSLNRQKYKLNYIYSIIEIEIDNLKKRLNWSGDFAYSMTAFKKMHRSYAEYLINKNLTLNDIENILKMVPKENKGRYNEDIIFRCYQNYMNGDI